MTRDEVLIRTEAASLNFGDLMLREGRYHAGSPPLNSPPYGGRV